MIAKVVKAYQWAESYADPKQTGWFLAVVGVAAWFAGPFPLIMLIRSFF